MKITHTKRFGWSSKSRLTPALPILAVAACGGTDIVHPPDGNDHTTTPTSIAVSQAAVSFVSLGETATITVTVSDAAGNPIQDAATAWESSNATIARVTSTGEITATDVGDATLTASSGAVSATVTVSVTQVPASVVSGQESLSLVRLGKQDTATATVRDARNNAIFSAPISWQSSDNAVATVDQFGVITSTGRGTAHIRAISGDVADSMEVTVAATFGETVPALLDSIFARFGVPGVAVGVLEDGVVTWAGGKGNASNSPQRPVGSSTPFFIASISKTFVGWAASNLEARGLLDLDQPVEDFLDTWRYPPSQFNPSESTLGLLLAHQGGASVCCYPGFPPGAPLPTTQQSLDGATNGVGRVELIYAPGTQTQYAGGGITVSQLAIENVSGKGFGQFMADNFFQPLGMNNSTFELTPTLESNIAIPFNDDGSVADFPNFAALGAAGMISTVDDMLIFAKAVADGAAGTSTVPGMESSVINDLLATTPFTPPSIRYELGQQVRKHGGIEFIGHAGSHPGYTSQYQIAPKEGHAVVVLVNRRVGGGSTHNAITCRWFQAVTGTSPAEYCWVFN